MSETRRCAQCGSPLAGELGNCCPRCLLGLGLGPGWDGARTRGPGTAEWGDDWTPVLGTFGDYELIEEIAHGGMGVVFKARQRSLSRLVAVKMIRAGRLASVEEVQRFRAEAETAAHLQHPNIVAIHEVGEWGGQHFYSMDFVEGRNLADLAREGSVTARRAAGYVRVLAQAVHYAHRHGVLHRDLKSSNVLIDLQDQPRITDFGLAKRVAWSGDATSSAPVLGTPGYMAPEQAAGTARLMTTAVDVYGLGAILYDLLAGRPPFVGDSPMATLQQVIESEPPRLRSLDPKLDRDLETLCLKCLEKDPGRRYGSALALAEDLDRWLRREPIHARPSGVRRRAVKWARRQPALATLIATLCVATAAFVGQRAASRVRVQEALARLRIRTAEEHLGENTPVGLAYLARVLRDDPGRRVAAERLLAALSCRRFLLPRSAPFRHLDAIHSARFSPEAARVVTASDDGTAQIWDVRTGAKLGVALRHAGPVRWAEFSPDGALVVTASCDGTARIWDAGTGQPLSPPLEHPAEQSRFVAGDLVDLPSLGGKRLRGPSRPVDLWLAGQLSPATTAVLAGYGGDRSDFVPLQTNLLRDLNRLLDGPLVYEAQRFAGLDLRPETTNLLARDPRGEDLLRLNRMLIEDAYPQELLRVSSRAVNVARFSPNGRRVATACDNHTARVWEVPTGRPVTGPLRHEGPVFSVAFSPDNRRVVTGTNCRAQVWDAETGEPAAPLAMQRDRIHGNWVCQTEFSHDGLRLATASIDKTARVWDAVTGQPVTPPLVHRAALRSLEFSADDRWLLTGCMGGTATVWDTRSEAPPVRIELNSVLSAQFDPDGARLVTACVDGQVRLWGARTGQPIGEPLHHAGPVFSARFSADGTQVLTASGDGTARVWDAQLRPMVAPATILGGSRGAQGGADALLDAVFSHDGQWVATASSNGIVQLWQAESGQARWADPLRHRQAVNTVRFSSDDQWLVTASRDGTVRISSAATGQTDIRPLQHDESGFYVAEFSPDGHRILTGAYCGFAALWDARTGAHLGQARNPTLGDIRAVAYSPDGRACATADDGGTAQIRDAGTLRPIAFGLRHHEAVNSVGFSPDGMSLVTASWDTTARVWDARTGAPRTAPLRHQGRVVRAEFSPDGRRVVTASYDRTARLWDARTGRSITEPLGHRAEVLFAQFSPDGRWVATASRDGAARVWDARAGLPVSEPLRHEGGVNTVRFSPDAQSVLTASDDGTARLWPLLRVEDPAPIWLIDLAEALGGLRLNNRGELTPVPLDQLFELQSRLRDAPPHDFFARWARWFFADPAHRSAAPR